MPIFEQQQEQLNRQRAESQEAGMESKEGREEKEAQEMGAKERMEKTVVEVKNTKQRMQNIMVNISQVLAAVRAIRAKLGLNQAGDVPAVQRDEATLAELKQKLSELMSQIGDLKLALKAEELARLRQADPNMNEQEMDKQANQSVDRILAELGYSADQG